MYCFIVFKGHKFTTILPTNKELVNTKSLKLSLFIRILNQKKEALCVKTLISKLIS